MSSFSTKLMFMKYIYKSLSYILLTSPGFKSFICWTHTRSWRIFTAHDILCLVKSSIVNFKSASSVTKNSRKISTQLHTDDERWYWGLEFGSKLTIVWLLCHMMALYTIYYLNNGSGHWLSLIEQILYIQQLLCHDD